MVKMTLDTYRLVQKKRIAKLQAGKRRGPITTAQYFALQLRLLSPYGVKNHSDYPHMRDTVRRQRSSVRMSGTNPNTGYPYIHWVNATPGTNLRSWGRTYRQVRNKTGMPGFYWEAQKRASEFGRDAHIEMVSKILKSSF
jgi:hypothetical protein